jgi:hypothetical protein
MNRYTWVILLGVSVIALSCSKKAVSPTLPVSAPKPTLNVEETDFTYMDGKARMILRDANKEREVKANIRVRKDSVIWMTFSVIGVQGGKALINQDSITIVSNVDKEFYVFEYSELSKRYNFEINYKVIEAAILGNLLMPRKETDDVRQEPSYFVLKQSANDVTVDNFVNAASMKVEKVELKEATSNNTLVINYSNFQPLGSKLLPYNGTINLFYKTVSGLLNTTVIFEYNKAEVKDKELKFPFNIPKRYVRR